MNKKYIIRDSQGLNIQFYQHYDDSFLFRKADTLMFIVENYQDLNKLVEQKGGSIDETEKKYLEGLRAEIHFTEMHRLRHCLD